MLDAVAWADAEALVRDTIEHLREHGQTVFLDAEHFFEDGLGREIHFANDADVAGVAEARYGARLVPLQEPGTSLGIVSERG
mgnify:CR=1 FL=1